MDSETITRIDKLAHEFLREAEQRNTFSWGATVPLSPANQIESEYAQTAALLFIVLELDRLTDK